MLGLATYTIFAIGTLWFWLLSIAAVVVITVCAETESTGKGVFSFLVYVILLQWFGGVHVFQWLTAHPLSLFVYFLFYLAAGTVWSTLKWTFFCRTAAAIYRETRDNLLLKSPYKYKLEGGGLDKPRLNDDVQGELRYSVGPVPPQVVSHKQRIIAWMTWWPFSMMWSVLDDFVRKAFEHIYSSIRVALQSISNRIFAGVVEQS